MGGNVRLGGVQHSGEKRGGLQEVLHDGRMKARPACRYPSWAILAGASRKLPIHRAISGRSASISSGTKVWPLTAVTRRRTLRIPLIQCSSRSERSRSLMPIYLIHAAVTGFEICTRSPTWMCVVSVTWTVCAPNGTKASVMLVAELIFSAKLPFMMMPTCGSPMRLMAVASWSAPRPAPRKTTPDVAIVSAVEQ
jgi:hypothetical protein